MSAGGGSIAIGTLLHDRYEVLGHLGGGSAGEVLKVRDHNLDCIVALKLLKPRPGQSPTWSEAQLLQSLRGEFLLPVLNAAVIPGLDLRYITTPLAEEGDLGGAAGAHGAPLRSGLGWCQQVATALARVHDAGLLHRDVKPENVFLSSGSALLGDLGLAALMDAAGSAEGNGTQYTAAPELFQGRRCTIQSEIYSLGATTFIALTGVWPRGHGCTPDDVALKAIAGEGPRLRDLAPHVPTAVETAVARAMAREPDARFATAAEYSAALGRAARSISTEWRRTDEHDGHTVCLRSGPRKQRRAVLVCLVPAGELVEVQITTVGAGVRLRAQEPMPVPPSGRSRRPDAWSRTLAEEDCRPPGPRSGS